MGKRTRKTRWRTLAIGDEHSDSEESNATLDTRVPPTYHQKYYNKFTYSSQSTPTRRYQSDSLKSTRSSSTASENKITFNEDEYTKITTPRQDVLFKKGYLNKPKTYTTQTSTGNSTTSTGNSTGNGTPEYQSTDLEYESQFVFPNGFLDQNGIYYVNSYDPYPLMVYNAPTYYNSDSCGRTKKYSTESLTESASTSNEETPQETASTPANHNGVGHGDDVQHATPPPQVNGHQHHHHPQHHMPPPTAEYGQVYNVVYPGFYYNGLCPPQELVNCQNNPSDSKRIKRRRRRKLPSDLNTTTNGHAQNGTTSEYTEDEFSSVEEEDEDKQSIEESSSQDHSTTVSPPSEHQTNENSETDAKEDDKQAIELNGDHRTQGQQIDDPSASCNDQDTPNETAEKTTSLSETNKEDKKVKYDLKPDAQEFVPRSMRPENLQYIKIQPGFVQVPLMAPMGAPNFGHPGFLPPGMTVGYIQQNPAMYPGYMPGFLPTYPEPIQTPMGPPIEEIPQMEIETQPNKSDIDIKTVVSKLEEVANDPQIPEKRNNGNSHPYKKPGQHKNYEDRRKFLSRNNNTVQNGYYPKRFQNSRPQNEAVNETPIKEHINENKECSNVTESTDVDCVQHVIPSSINIEESAKQIEPTEAPIVTKQSDIQRQPKDVAPAIQNDIPEEQMIIPNNPMKFQQRSTITKTVEHFHAPSKDNNHNETRNRWQRKDDKPFQKRDQTVQENRLHQVYMQNGSPNHKFNKRFTPNSPLRKQTATQTAYFSNENPRRYSETVKKSQSKIINNSAVAENSTTPKKTKPGLPEVINTPTNQTQWISVSSKKKRRNKNVEDSDNGSETPIVEEEEVIPPECPESKLENFQQNEFLQNMINGHAKVDESKHAEVEEVPEIVRKSPVKILEVRDLEKELLSNVGVEVKDDNESEVKIVEPNKQKSSSKKKQKKGGQKQLTKRVFVTDSDLAQLLPEIKKEEPKINVIEPEKVEEETSIVEIVPEISEVTEEIVTVLETIVPESTEKKSKKKKKKSKNVEILISTNAEDTYDLLLENTFSNNSEDKTNMEISQELDLIIQRGMYSNLEEKIKALNIIPVKEEFFQSVVRSSRESSTEKSPEFTKLLANSLPKFKYSMATVEDDVSKVTPNSNQPSTSRMDLFVENSEVNDLLNDIYGKEGTPEAEIGKLITRVTPPRDIEVETREKSVEKVKEEERNGIDKEKLYPITQAVKNWMSKTRENTPEVEILKSPSKIFKEFYEIDETSSKNGLFNGKRSSVISESDEEITVYSASRNNSDSADLLDCWENEISSSSDPQNLMEEESTKIESNEEEEEVLEVYESKYGQNEDFLELQREIEGKKKLEQEARSRNFPKHGALPYRAICCNVM